MDSENNSLLSVLGKLSKIFKTPEDKNSKTEPEKPDTPLSQTKKTFNATDEFIKRHNLLAEKIRNAEKNNPVPAHQKSEPTKTSKRTPAHVDQSEPTKKKPK